MKYDLSVIIPSIEPELLESVYEQLYPAIGKYTAELIYVGPKLPRQKLIEEKHFKFYIDRGCPSRSFQIGTFFAEGEYLAFLPDDIKIMPESLEKCIEVLKNGDRRDGVTLRYSEGVGYTGNQDQDSAYWIAHTHDDMKSLPGVKDGWRTAPLFMYNTTYYREMGGLDCRFEHVNMNTHDFAFRTQKIGGILHPSPTKVAAANWNPEYAKGILFQAYVQNDNPLFRQLYSAFDPGRVKIDYTNWMNIPSEWPRRYR